MCVHFFNFDHLRMTLQSSDLIWGTKFCASSLPLPPFIFSYLQALIHGFLWWWASSWLIFSLKWHLQSSFFLLHSTSIHLQEAKGSIDEEDPRPRSSTWSYIRRGGSTNSGSECRGQDVSEVLNPMFNGYTQRGWRTSSGKRWRCQRWFKVTINT